MVFGRIFMYSLKESSNCVLRVRVSENFAVLGAAMKVIHIAHYTSVEIFSQQLYSPTYFRYRKLNVRDIVYFYRVSIIKGQGQ